MSGSWSIGRSAGTLMVVVGDILQPTHLLLVLVVALLVLGPKRLPEVARHLGTGIRDFREAISGEQVDRTTDPTRQVTPDSPPAEAMQTQAVVAEPEPVAARPEPTVTEVIPEPETSQTDAVVAAPAHEPEPSPAQVLAEPEPEPSRPPAQRPGPAPASRPPASQPSPTSPSPRRARAAEANQTDPRPDHTEQAATAPLAAPEHPPEPAADEADAATTELSSQRPT